jgi:hypothetical protein
VIYIYIYSFYVYDFGNSKSYVWGHLSLLFSSMSASPMWSHRQVQLK